MKDVDLLRPLLFSFPFAAVGKEDRDLPVPDAVAVDDRSPDALERQHGDGNFADRALMLEISLQAIKERGADMKAVHTILKRVRRQHFDEQRKWNRMLAWRDAEDERSRKVKPALSSLVALRKWLDNAPSSIDSDSIADHVAVVIADLKFLSLRMTEERRKLPRGKHAMKYVGQARNDLRMAGVPDGVPGIRVKLLKAGVRADAKNMLDRLLMSVGVLAYHASR